MFHHEGSNLPQPIFVRNTTYSKYSPYYFFSVILAAISNLRLDGVFWPWIALVLARLMSFRLVCLCLINMIFKQIMAPSDKNVDNGRKQCWKFNKSDRNVLSNSQGKIHFSRLLRPHKFGVYMYSVPAEWGFWVVMCEFRFKSGFNTSWAGFGFRP